jgi:hypothetical protein
MLVVKYDSAGTNIWSQTLSIGGTMPYSEITGMSIHSHYLDVIGTNTDNYNTDIVTAEVDDSTNNMLYWSQIWSSADNTINLPSNIYSSGNDVYANGVTINSAGKRRWVTIKYSSYQRDTARVYVSGQAVALKNAMIVAFAPSKVKREVVDGTDGSDLVFGTPSTYLKIRFGYSGK